MNQQQPRDLLERYIKGECSDEEARAEEQRLVRDLWERIATRENEDPGMEPENRIRNRRVLRYAAIWAGMIIVSGGIWMQWGRRGLKSASGKTSAYTAIATGYQQARKVLLPDSSIVWINSATHISFPEEFATHREVRLSGEAFFDVKADVNHPFVVLAENTSTTVFGTSFNISAYPAAGELRISLKSGKVGIAFGKMQKVLLPGQLMIYHKRSGSGEVLQEAPGEMDAWTGGRMLFFKTPLKEALSQIEARYGVHIAYDHGLTDRTITARFENTALEKVLQSLSFGWDLHFVRTGDTLHVR
jgi:ferric-dicitrate binding protein FerR (iron transport regulator)